MSAERPEAPAEPDATQVFAEILRPPEREEAQRRQPLRPRHVPQRTCVGCRSQLSKRELVRVVRTPAGEVEVDPTGRSPGRGAYLHRDPACWTEGLKKGRLARSLHVTTIPETVGAYFQGR